LMTGFGTIDTAVDAMKAGAVDYIVKPFKLKLVLAVLSRALGIRQLRQENEKLNQHLAARTRELEAANRELEAFAYSVSHDLRAPLRSIEAFTELLIEESQSGNRDNLSDFGQRIRRGVTRMTTMIDDLLRLGTALRSEVNRSRVDLAPIGREIMNKLQSSAPQRKLAWTLSDNATVLGDPGLLQIVMENLLMNAWKYSSRREVTRIEIGVQHLAGETVISVRDNGIGFDMAEVGKLFSPFQRLRSAREYEGTGIGLATVQRIIQRHGGRIWAEAEPDKGATFSFSLPEGNEVTNRDRPPGADT